MTKDLWPDDMSAEEIASTKWKPLFAMTEEDETLARHLLKMDCQLDEDEADATEDERDDSHQ
jgi:hypothetical protein